MISDVVLQTIIHYLGSHKRLVIPQLGTFIVKVPGESVVFSELLRTDDGVLHGLLCASGMGELEAAGAVDRFVFEVRHAVQNGEDYVMTGFGTLYAGPNGTTLFTYDPGAYVVKMEPERFAAPRPEPRITPSHKLNPDPSLRGLRYGKPEKNTDAYRYHAPRRHGVDKVILAAIVVSVLALATIAYVYIRDSRGEELETEFVEQAAEEPVADTPIPQE